jgi:hypothetical protein
MPDKLQFDENTTISVAQPEQIESVSIQNLSSIAEIEHEDGHVTSFEIDISKLIDQLTIYTSTESHRYGWRRKSDTDLKK